MHKFLIVIGLSLVPTLASAKSDNRIIGKWSSACKDDIDVSHIDTVEITADKIINHTMIYADENCKTAFQEIVAERSYMTGFNSTLTAKFTRMDMRYLRKEFIDYINNNKEDACELYNWKLGVYKSVAGRCGLLQNMPNPGIFGNYPVIGFTETGRYHVAMDMLKLGPHVYKKVK